MYTPKPWTFEGGEWIIGDGGEKIAQVYNWYPGYLDNGQLIATAPDLLEALVMLHDLLEDNMDDAEWYLRKHHNVAKQAIEEARERIIT